MKHVIMNDIYGFLLSRTTKWSERTETPIVKYDMHDKGKQENLEQ